MIFGGFRGGVNPPSSKNTMELATVRMDVPSKVVIPMNQHIGAPCQALVKKGDNVKVGQVIGNAGSYVSAPIHSSVSGTVTSIDERIISASKPIVCVEIKPDGLQELSEEVKPPSIDSRESFLNAIKASGLTGLGGAGFPTHVKLNPPEEVVVDLLLINAAECEPYITSDYRECMENSSNIIEGINHVLKWTDRQPGQLSLWPYLLEEKTVPDLADFNDKEVAVAEEEILGFSLLHHPLHFYQEQLNGVNCVCLKELPTLPAGQEVSVAAFIMARSRRRLKQGGVMLTLFLSDETGFAEAIFYPAVYRRLLYCLKEKALFLTGKTSEDGDSLIVHQALPLALLPKKQENKTCALK